MEELLGDGGLTRMFAIRARNAADVLPHEAFRANLGRLPLPFVRR